MKAEEVHLPNHEKTIVGTAQNGEVPEGIQGERTQNQWTIGRGNHQNSVQEDGKKSRTRR